MTKREFFQAICKANVSDELKDFAHLELAKLDVRNEKRADYNSSKRAKENEPLKVEILKALTDCGLTISDLVEVVDISQQKASALCRQLVDEGKLTVTEVKIPKKGKRKFYEVVEYDGVQALDRELEI